MTVEELQTKLNDAQAKVEKRINTITKICKKLGLDFDTLMSEYNQIKDLAKNEKKDYLSHAYAKRVIDSIAEEKPERDENGNWIDDNYEYNSKLSDLTDSLCKLFDVERVRDNWQVKLQTQQNKESAPKIPVLWEFLNNWKALATDWYHNNAEHLIDCMNEHQALFKQFVIDNDYFNSQPRSQNMCHSLFVNHFAEENGYRVSKYSSLFYDAKGYAKNIKKVDALTIELAQTKYIPDPAYSYHELDNASYAFGRFELVGFDDVKLDKILEAEKLRKYETLCEQITSAVGEITDCQYLHIGPKGDLNGIVIGTLGRASVETIGAGGYNIQCFHFRTLVHKLRD